MRRVPEKTGRSAWARGTCSFVLCIVVTTRLLMPDALAQAATPTETLQQLYAEANRLLGRPTTETQAQERLPAIRQLFVGPPSGPLMAGVGAPSPSGIPVIRQEDGCP